MAVLRHRLKRWPRNADGLSRYRHPGGYVINQRKRDWDLRGLTRGAAHQYSPLYWWEVKKLFAISKAPQNFDTLREARAWCDEQTAADNDPLIQAVRDVRALVHRDQEHAS